MKQGRIRLFGDFRLWAPNGDPIALSGRKERAILALLALHQGETLSRDRIVEDIWGQDDPSDRRSFNTALWRLRKALRDADPVCENWLGTTGETLRLRLRRGPIVDSTTVRNVIDQYRKGHCHPAAVSDIVERVGGTLLPGLATDWIAECRRSIETDLRRIILDATQALLDKQPEAAISLAEFAVGLDSYDERAWRMLMRAQMRTGRQAVAHITYGELEALLADELGIAPSAETRALIAGRSLPRMDDLPGRGMNTDVLGRLDALSDALSVVTGEVAALRAELRRA